MANVGTHAEQFEDVSYDVNFRLLMEEGVVGPANSNQIPLDLHPQYAEPSTSDLRPFDVLKGLPADSEDIPATSEKMTPTRGAEDEVHRGDDGYGGLYRRSRHHESRHRGTGLPVVARAMKLEMGADLESAELPEIDGVIVAPEEVEALDSFRNSEDTETSYLA